MSVSQTIRSKLNAIFATDFDCYNKIGNQNQVVIRPRALPKLHGFEIDAYEVYPGSYRAAIRFESFSRNVVESWFDSPANVDAAFAFALEIAPNTAINMKFGGVRAHDYNSFIEHLEANWLDTGLSVTFAHRVDSDSNQNEELDNISIVATGFALIASGLVRNPEAAEDDSVEGDEKTSPITRYERSPVNRARCIAHFGTSCYVCSFDFGKVYGSFAEGYIEVHHKTPVSQLEKPRAVNPITDMVPLCPNCHAVVHMFNPPMDPDKLKSILLKGNI